MKSSEASGEMDWNDMCILLKQVPAESYSTLAISLIRKWIVPVMSSHTLVVFALVFLVVFKQRKITFPDL